MFVLIGRAENAFKTGFIKEILEVDLLEDMRNTMRGFENIMETWGFLK